jgi:hypothetical protein
VKLVDKQGASIEVPEDQAAEALASGQYGVPAGEDVPVKLDDGQIGTVPGHALQAALGSGATIISRQEHADAVKQAKYGGLTGQAVAGVAGAARGASLGLSDVAARGIGGQETADYLRSVQEANPVTSGIGEVAGALAPALLSGGATAAEEAPGALAALGRLGGRLAAAPGEAVSGLGSLGEAAVSRLLPKEATSLAGRLGSKALEGAARGGLEGAAYGAGDAISEQALSQNPDFDGEKFLSAIGHGALLGAVGGGVLGGAGQAGREVLGSLSPRLQGLAEGQAVNALEPTGKMLSKAEEIPGGSKAIGRELLDSGLIQHGETIEASAPRIEAAREAAGKTVGDVLDRADAAGFKGPHVGTILEGFDSAAEKLQSAPSLNKPAIERLNALKDDLANLAGGEVGVDSRLGFSQAQELRRRIDVEAKWASNPLAPVPELAKAMRSARGVIEDEIERAGDAASKKLGGSFAEEYAAAKERFQRLAIADDMAQSAVVRRAAGSRGTSELGALGAVLNLASGHPVAAAASLGTRAARRFVGDRASSTAAVMLDKLGALGGVQRATSAIDRQISRGVARATGDTSAAAVKLRKPVEGGYDAMRRSVEDAVEDAQAHTEAVAAAAAPIAQHSPKVAQAFERAAIRATLYLAQALPSSRPTNALTPKLDRAEPSDSEKATFTRIYQAVHDPTSVLARVEDGTVTPDEVAAIQATAPETYAAMSTQLKDSLATAKDPKRLPYARRLALSVFLQAPVDATMTPQFIAACQAASAPPSPPPSKGGHAKASKLSIAKTTRLAGQGTEA